MAKIIAFPGVDLNPPSRAEIVEEAATILMQEVSSVFIEQRIEHKAQAVWYKEIRKYLWREDIKLNEHRDFRFEDLMRWKHHWRTEALDYIRCRLGR